MRWKSVLLSVSSLMLATYPIMAALRRFLKLKCIQGKYGAVSGPLAESSGEEVLRLTLH